MISACCRSPGAAKKLKDLQSGRGVDCLLFFRWIVEWEGEARDVGDAPQTEDERTKNGAAARLLFGNFDAVSHEISCKTNLPAATYKLACLAKAK